MVTVSPGKHRRFEQEPLGAAEDFRAPPGVAGPAAGSSGAWGPASAAAFSRQAGQLADCPAANGSAAIPVPDWPPDSPGASWPRWDGPPPALHPDHPSAPVPRVRVPQAPALAGPVPLGRAAPGTPAGPMTVPPAGPPRLPRRRPTGPGPSGAPNAGAWFNGAGPRAGGPGPASSARNMPRAQQDFNTGDIYNSGQFSPVPADFPERTNRPARPNRPGPANRPARPGRPAALTGAPRPNWPARGGGPAQDYSIGRGFGPPPGQSYRPTNGSGRGPGAAARTDSTAPRQGYHGGQGRAPVPQFPSGPAPAAVALADPAWQRGPRDTGSLRDSQMPAMPGGQAPAVAQAWSQATAIRERAEQDAAAIRQEALAIREAAEREAADMRAAISSMSEQLGRMAAYLSESFPSGGTATALAANAPAALAEAPPAALPARPAARPPAPGTRPRPAPGTRTLPARPATRPARPATRPDRPVAKPGKSTTRPGTSQGRQVRAARKMFALLAILVTAGTMTGTAQIVLHGGRFFIFRENGAGASETGLTDSQFPGHPGAPAPPKHAK